MPRDGRQAHLKGLGELADRGFTEPEVRQNGSTGGVPKGAEGGGELVVGAFASHLYLTDWLNMTARFWCQAVCDETPGMRFRGVLLGGGRRTCRP